MAEFSEVKEEMEETLEELRGGDTIEGLDDEEAVVDNYVEEEFKELLEECETEEERTRKKKRFVEHYITGPGKKFIDEEIAKAKSAYTNAKAQIEELTQSISSLISSNALPSVLVVGQATGTANTAWTALDNDGKKQMILSLLKSITNFMAEVYRALLLLNFAVPSVITTTVAAISTLQALIGSIPV